MLSSYFERAYFRRGLLPKGQDADGGEIAATAAAEEPSQLRSHLEARPLPYRTLPKHERDGGRGTGHFGHDADRQHPAGHQHPVQEPAASMSDEHPNSQHAESAAAQPQRDDAGQLHDPAQERGGLRAELQPGLHDPSQKRNFNEQYRERDRRNATARHRPAPERQCDDPPECSSAAATAESEEPSRKSIPFNFASQQSGGQEQHESAAGRDERNESVIMLSVERRSARAEMLNSSENAVRTHSVLLYKIVLKWAYSMASSFLAYIRKYKI